MAATITLDAAFGGQPFVQAGPGSYGGLDSAFGAVPFYAIALAVPVDASVATSGAQSASAAAALASGSTAATSQAQHTAAYAATGVGIPPGVLCAQLSLRPCVTLAAIVLRPALAAHLSQRGAVQAHLTVRPLP